MKYYYVTYQYNGPQSDTIRFTRHESVIDFIANLYDQYSISRIEINYE